MDIVAAAAPLRMWILAGGGRAAPRPDNLDPELVLDNGIFRATGDEGIGLLVQGEPFADVRIVAEVLGATSTAGEACIAGCADHGCALDGSQAWVDGIALVEASRRVAEHAAALGDLDFAQRALDLRGRLATRLLGACRAHVGAAMLDSIRVARRSGDDVRAADLCRSVAADFAMVVDAWEPEAEAPYDEHRLAIDSLVAALDVLVALGVADADETRLRARAAAILAR